MGYDAEDYIYVDRERTRGLITALNAVADTLGTIRADEHASVMTAAVPGTGVSAACAAGSQTATTAVGSTTQDVRDLAARTDSGLATVVAQDQFSADQFPQV